MGPLLHRFYVCFFPPGRCAGKMLLISHSAQTHWESENRVRDEARERNRDRTSVFSRQRARDIDWCGMLSTEAGQTHVSHLLSGPLNSEQCYAVLTGFTGANKMSNWRQRQHTARAGHLIKNKRRRYIIILKLKWNCIAQWLFFLIPGCLKPQCVIQRRWLMTQDWVQNLGSCRPRLTAGRKESWA